MISSALFGDGAAAPVLRLAELLLAQRNTVRLRAQGAVEFGDRHYWFMIALHAWLTLLIGAQADGVWALASLGRRWTTRVLVLPGAPLITRGPYRLLRHPNYLVVNAELAVVPLALSLPCVALAFSAANLALLTWRIRVENRALAWATGGNRQVGLISDHDPCQQVAKTIASAPSPPPPGSGGRHQRP